MGIAFTQASDRISAMGSNPPIPVDGTTICFWAQLISDQNNYQTFIREHGDNGATTVFNGATNNDGVTPSIFTGGGSVIGPTSMIVGEWYHIVYMQNASTGTIAIAQGIDGDYSSVFGLVGSGFPTGLTIGGRSPSDATEWGNFGTAYFRVFNTVLTSDQWQEERLSRTMVNTNVGWADYEFSSNADLTDHFGGHDLTAGTTLVSNFGNPPLPEPPTPSGATVTIWGDCECDELCHGLC